MAGDCFHNCVNKEEIGVAIKAISWVKRQQQKQILRCPQQHWSDHQHQTSHPTSTFFPYRLKPSQPLSICLFSVSDLVSLFITDTCLFQAWAHFPSTVTVSSRWRCPLQHPNCRPAHWHSSQPQGFVTHGSNTLLHSIAKMGWHKQVIAMEMSRVVANPCQEETNEIRDD